MDRRRLIAAGLGLAAGETALRAYAQTPLPPARTTYQDQPPPGEPSGAMPPPPQNTPEYSPGTNAETYSQDELVTGVSNFLGVTAETAGAAIERIFRDNGRPTGYVAGEEASGAFIGGLRYGKGLLYMKNRPTQQLFWQGPTVGFDWGGNASRVFTLCYNLQYPDAIFRRFPGLEGSAYLVGGLGINYQKAEGIALAPIRAGVGLRLGANVGYLAYSRERHWFPL
jgi:hypothetical protein